MPSGRITATPQRRCAARLVGIGSQFAPSQNLDVNCSEEQTTAQQTSLKTAKLASDGRRCIDIIQESHNSSAMGIHSHFSHGADQLKGQEGAAQVERKRKREAGSGKRWEAQSPVRQQASKGSVKGDSGWKGARRAKQQLLGGCHDGGRCGMGKMMHGRDARSVQECRTVLQRRERSPG